MKALLAESWKNFRNLSSKASESLSREFLHLSNLLQVILFVHLLLSLLVCSSAGNFCSFFLYIVVTLFLIAGSGI